MYDEMRSFPDLFRAIKSKDDEKFRDLVSADPDCLFYYTAFAGGTWLHFASAYGTLYMVNYIIKSGIDIDQQDRLDGTTALVDASSEGRDEIVEFLLNNGARIDTSMSVRNPLFAASSGGNLGVARLLIKHGINTTVRYNTASMQDMDAMAFATMHEQPEIALVIAESQAVGDPKRIRALLEDAAAIAEANI